MKDFETERPNTPTLEKLAESREKYDAIEGFLDWAEGEMGLELCEGATGYSTHFRNKDLIATFLEINLDQVEAERVALLGWQRSLNNAA